MNRRNRVRRSLKGAAVMVVAWLVTVYLAEAFLRLALPVPGLASDEFQELPGYGIQVLKVGTYRDRLVDGWTEHTATITPPGFRNPKRAPGERVWAVIGDSFTFGIGVDDDAAWPAQLQRSLDAASDAGIQVWNLGIPGAGVLTYRQVARWAREHLEPELIILSLSGRNDLIADINEDFIKRAYRYRWLETLGLRQLRRRLNLLLEAQRQERREAAPSGETSAEAVFTGAWQGLLQELRDAGTPTLVVDLYGGCPLVDPVPGDATVEFLPGYFSGGYRGQALPAFLDQHCEPPFSIPGDSHWTTVGNAIAAHHVLQLAAAKGFVAIDRDAVRREALERTCGTLAGTCCEEVCIWMHAVLPLHRIGACVADVRPGGDAIAVEFFRPEANRVFTATGTREGDGLRWNSEQGLPDGVLDVLNDAERLWLGILDSTCRESVFGE